MVAFIKSKSLLRKVHGYVWHDLAVSALLVLPLAAGIYALISSRDFQLGGQLVNHVVTNQKVVALTFDDGPQPPYSDQVIGILKAEHVRATFFLIGEEMARHPQATQRLVESGNQIGNHTYTHNGLVFVSPANVAAEIEATDQLIRQHGYQGEIAFRPPYGMKLFWLPHYLAQHHRPDIMWSVVADRNNSSEPAADIVNRVMAQLRPGLIIDMHAMYANNQPSRQALPQLIKDIQAAGYRFATIDQLLTL